MKTTSTLLLFLMCNHFVLGQWNTNSAINNAIATGSDQQQASRIVSDGNGGAIITWVEYVPATNDNNIYAQRISSAGSILWTINGIAICTDPGLQSQVEVTSDGNGGAIIAWQDNRVFSMPQIYVQRINGNGVVQWTLDGISLGDGTVGHTQPQLISDDNGGAIVTWKIATTMYSRIYAQRIDAGGNILWTPAGVPMSTSLAPELPRIISDGAGGAILAWNEYVGVFPNGNHDIYAQRVNAAGVIQWGPVGSVLTTAPNNQTNAQLTTDGANGAIVVWPGPSSSPGANLYAQKLNAAGVIQWPLEGIAIAPSTVNQIDHKILTDGAGGAFITWSANSIVFVQRMSTAGSPLWTATGIRISNTSNCRFPQIVTDGGTGAIISWYTPFGANVLAQRVNSSGTIQWQTNGVFVSDESTSNQMDQQMIATPAGSAILSWTDFRNSATSYSDIFASQLKSDGTLGAATLPIKLLSFTLREINNTVQLRWQTTSEQNSHHFEIERSEDGNKFTVIGLIHAAGYSTTIKNYNYTDAFPLNNINFYRLKQVDTDTKYTYSAVIKTTDDKDAAFAVTPNPVQNFIRIINPGKTEKIDISIYDASGKLVKELRTKNQSPIIIEVQDFQPGLYFIRVFDGIMARQSKFIKK